MKKWYISLVTVVTTFSFCLAIILAYISTGGKLAYMLPTIIVLLGILCVLNALSIIALAFIVENNPNLK